MSSPKTRHNDLPGLKLGPVSLESKIHTSETLTFAMLRAALAIASYSASNNWRFLLPLV